MGRKTFDSIGKPLPNRTNIIVSRSDLNIEGTYCFNSIDEGISFAKSQNETELFIIGGDSIYKQSMDVLNTVYLTRIHHSFEADAFFPALQEEYWQLNQNEFHAADEKNKFEFSFQTYNRK
jgi:dihydrofolate reductase